MTRRGGKENSKMREMTGKGWPKREQNGNKRERIEEKCDKG